MSKKAKRSQKLKTREQKKAREAVRYRQKRAHSLDEFKANPETGYEFWLLHGANFLLSSYEEGVWSPLFPEAYEGRPVSRTELFRRLFRDHLDPKTNLLSPSGTKTIAWASLKPDQMYSLVFRARAAARKNGSDPLSPGQPDVWEFLYVVMSTFVERMNAAGKTQEGKFELPVEEYGNLLPEAVAATLETLSSS